MHTSAPGDVLVSKRAFSRAAEAPRALLTPTRQCRSAVSRISCRPQLLPQHRSRLHCITPPNEEAAAAQTHPASQPCGSSDASTSAPSRAASGAADAPSSSATPSPAVLPAATRVLKRVHVTPGSGSVLDEAGMHKPVGLVLFSAYVLGTASSLAGITAPAWVAALTGAAIGGLFAALNRFCHARLWRSPSEPLSVVITGGSRGLGKALAREFLQAGDKVLITGTSAASLAQAMTSLASETGAGARNRLFGVVADVSNPSDVSRLGSEAKTALGAVDVWLCNAGCSGSFAPFLGASDEALEKVVRTNLLGALLCAREAATLMLEQQLGGHLFLMDGAGADGGATPQYAAYGATKAALPQLAATLQDELSGTHIGVHVLSPGMMLTGLLLEGATQANKAVFNILCEHPETVAAFLVPRVRSAVGQGLSGTYTKYLTPASAMWRFLTAPARVGRFFDKDGKAVYPAEEERIRGAKHAKATARRQAAARTRSSGLGVAYSLSLVLGLAVVMMDAAAGNADMLP